MPAGPAVSAWAVASLAGAVVAAALIVLVVIVSRAVTRTADAARELVTALEEVQGNTLVLADLEERTAAASQLTTRATAVLKQLQDMDSEEDGRGPKRQ